MKFIYFGNNINSFEDLNNLTNMSKYINKSLNPDDILIYGGSYLNPNINLNPSQMNLYFKSIESIDLTKKKMFSMFGDFDMIDETIFNNEITYYKTNKIEFFNDFINLENPDMNSNIFITDKTLIIIFDSNLLMYPNPQNILVSESPYKNLFNYFSNKINILNDKTIKDLIDYQFESIIEIINKYSNINEIIFITQNPLFSSENLLKDFCKWLSDFYFKLNYKIYWLCTNYSHYESGKININLKENTDLITNLEITQIILGNNTNISTTDDYSKNISTTIEITSPYTNTKYQMEIKYNIDEIKKTYGYLEFKKRNYEIVFNFIDLNELNKKVLSEDSSFPEVTIPYIDFSDVELIKDIDLLSDNDFKTNVNPNSKNKKCVKTFDNILKNIMIIDNSDSSDDDSEDKYKKKYIKYKTKLLKLRDKQKNIIK